MSAAAQECVERDKLRVAYREAVLLWIEMGGTNADVMHLPKAIAAKKDLDEAAAKLIEHRKQHNC